MARPLYSVKLFQAVTDPFAAPQAFGPPDGYVWVLRNLSVSTVNGLATPSYQQPIPGGDVGLFNSSGGPLSGIYFNPPCPQTFADHWEGRVVVEFGDELYLPSSSVSTWWLKGDGYLLSTP